MEPKQLEPGKSRGKCRKWQLRVRLGIDPRTGKYCEKTRTFTGSYRQAVAATESFEEEVKNLDTVEVTGSIPVSPTIETRGHRLKRSVAFLFEYRNSAVLPNFCPNVPSENSRNR